MDKNSVDKLNGELENERTNICFPHLKLISIVFSVII